MHNSPYSFHSWLLCHETVTTFAHLARFGIATEIFVFSVWEDMKLLITFSFHALMLAASLNGFLFKQRGCLYFLIITGKGYCWTFGFTECSKKRDSVSVLTGFCLPHLART